MIIRFLAFAMTVLLAIPVTAREVTFEQAAAYVSSAHSAFGNMSPSDLQVSYRLLGLRWEMGYRLKPTDLANWKLLLEKPEGDYYGRLCAASFLIDTDAEAQTFLEEQLNAANLRHRYNAAKVLMIASGDNSSAEVKEWELNLMIDHLADGSLDQVPIEQPVGDYPDGDAYDIDASPVDEFCYRLGTLKIKEAVPAILLYLQRPPKKNPLILDSLGDIGDPQAIPYLLKDLKDSDDAAYALGKLKSTEALPLLIAKLSRRDDPSIHYFQGPDDIILRALRDIGDRRVVGSIRAYLQAENRAPENISTAQRVLIELSSPDPVKDLIAQLDQEPSELARGDILSDLADIYRDPRIIATLGAVSESSSSAFLRQRAIGGLGRIGTKASLLELAAMLNRTFPNELATEWGVKGSPTDFTAYFHEFVAGELRDATHQNFGENAAKWQQWIETSPL
jgi:HEAT repeat protein